MSFSLSLCQGLQKLAISLRCLLSANDEAGSVTASVSACLPCCDPRVLNTLPSAPFLQSVIELVPFPLESRAALMWQGLLADSGKSFRAFLIAPYFCRTERGVGGTSDKDVPAQFQVRKYVRLSYTRVRLGRLLPSRKFRVLVRLV